MAILDALNAFEAPVLEVIRLMAEHHIGSVLVMQGEELVGIATERDYARKVILQGRSSAETPVSHVVSAPVVTVAPSDTAQHCSGKSLDACDEADERGDLPDAQADQQLDHDGAGHKLERRGQARADQARDLRLLDVRAAEVALQQAPDIPQVLLP